MPKPHVARMQHFAIEVSDTQRSIEFYRKALGFKLTESHNAHEITKIPVALTFMRIATQHHELVLVHNPAKKYTKRALPQDDLEGPPSFHHFAMECDSRADWLAVLEQVQSMDVEIVRGPVVHSFTDPRGDGSWGENEAFYFLDPDGHRIEIFCEMASIDPDGMYRNAKGVRLEGVKASEV
ncbi:MAG: catechol 2,3-dioxygenase-like lactoylglutathione lyase family enzyme [Paracoccaceae bacterium]|jgi:catechol 2,3-dioxygenase-like lactoylglutathione lyase family enzyme